MGHKVHPKVVRLHTTATWNSKWYTPKRHLGEKLREDYMIRSFFKKYVSEAGVTGVEIERTNQYIQITVYSSKPGILIGRSGAGINDITKQLKDTVLFDKTVNLKVNVKEVVGGRVSAAVVTQQIVQDIERRIPFRRSAKRALDQVMQAGALGAKIIISGRLDGAEIARTESFIQGKVPLHTLRADIDYYRAAAFTTYGAIGIKVWIYKGEVFSSAEQKRKKKNITSEQAAEA